MLRSRSTDGIAQQGSARRDAQRGRPGLYPFVRYQLSTIWRFVPAIGAIVEQRGVDQSDLRIAHKIADPTHMALPDTGVFEGLDVYARSGGRGANQRPDRTERPQAQPLRRTTAGSACRLVYGAANLLNISPKVSKNKKLRRYTGVVSRTVCMACISIR
jgi:hypothetical protein